MATPPPVSDQDRRLARKARMVAIVLVMTMVSWMGAQFLGGRIGLPVRFVFLFDFAALAAFGWALFVIYQLWQARGRETSRPPNGG